MIKSMTAFARQQSHQKFGTLVWEVRSVNSRYLDVNFRMPENFRELESVLRETVGKHLSRGKIDCNLNYQTKNAKNSELKVNQKLVKSLKDAAQQIRKSFKEELSVNLTDIMRWPGVLQTIEDDQSALNKMVVELFVQTLKELNQTREREGSKLVHFIELRLLKIEKELEKVHKALPKILNAQKTRLLDRFKELKADLDPNRLEQEMVILAQRADVAEELDRLGAHIKEARHVLQSGKAVGRRLDFLMQEFNREANTLGSKSISEITTKVSVELKVLIEQMREQVQNIE